MTFEGICAEIRTLASTYIIKADRQPSDDAIRDYFAFSQIFPLPLRICIREAVMTWVNEVEPDRIYRGYIVRAFRLNRVPIRSTTVSQALQALAYEQKLIWHRGFWHKATPELVAFYKKYKKLRHQIEIMTPETMEQNLVDLINLARNMQGK